MPATRPAPRTIGEHALISILSRIVIETMDYPPVRRYDSESFLPSHLIAEAQDVLARYQADIAPSRFHGFIGGGAVAAQGGAA